MTTPSNDRDDPRVRRGITSGLRRTTARTVVLGVLLAMLTTGFHGNGCGNPCGNGVLQPDKGEECDDGNHLAGDGCSANCKLQVQPLQTTCVASTEASYLAAFGSNGEFQGARDYMVHQFGYASQLVDVLACNEGYATTSYIGFLRRPDGTLTDAMIVSRSDMNHGLNTYVYRSESSSVHWVYTSPFVIRTTLDGSNQVSEMKYFDFDGNEILADAGSSAMSTPKPKCSELDHAYRLCLKDNIGTDLEDFVLGLGSAVNCVFGAAPSKASNCPSATLHLFRAFDAECPNLAPDGKACQTEDNCYDGTCTRDPWYGPIFCLPNETQLQHPRCPIDDFERPSLGSNWATTGIWDGDCAIAGSSDFTSAVEGGLGYCYYDPFTPTTAQYSCAQLSGVVGDCEVSVCVGMAPDNAFCCYFHGGSSDPYWGPVSWVNGLVNFHGGALQMPVGQGGYVGVERDADGQTFHCYSSTNGIKWTRLADDPSGATAFVRSGLPTPGRAGAGAAADVSCGGGGFLLERWQAGNGKLPTVVPCAYKAP